MTADDSTDFFPMQFALAFESTASRTTSRSEPGRVLFSLLASRSANGNLLVDVLAAQFPLGARLPFRCGAAPRRASLPHLRHSRKPHTIGALASDQRQTKESWRRVQCGNRSCESIMHLAPPSARSVEWDIFERIHKLK